MNDDLAESFREKMRQERSAEAHKICMLVYFQRLPLTSLRRLAPNLTQARLCIARLDVAMRLRADSNIIIREGKDSETQRG